VRRLLLAATLLPAVLLTGCGGDDEPGAAGSAQGPGPTQLVSGATVRLRIPADWRVLDLQAYRSGHPDAATAALAVKLDVASREGQDQLEVMAARVPVADSRYTEDLHVEVARGADAELAVQMFRAATAVGADVEQRDTALGEAEVAMVDLPMGPEDLRLGLVLVQREDSVVSVVVSTLDEQLTAAVVDLAITTLEATG